MVDNQIVQNPDTGADEFFFAYTYEEQGKPGTGDGEAFGAVSMLTQRAARADALADYNKNYGN